jgi:hypothetical protein
MNERRQVTIRRLLIGAIVLGLAVWFWNHTAGMIVEAVAVLALLFWTVLTTL